MTEHPASASTEDLSVSPMADVPAVQVQGPRFCGVCGTPLAEGPAECVTCQRRRESAVSARSPSADWVEVKSALRLYFSLLAVSIVLVIVALATDDRISTQLEIAAQIVMSAI